MLHSGQRWNDWGWIIELLVAASSFALAISRGNWLIWRQSSTVHPDTGLTVSLRAG
jgi:hypothetical protein